VKENKQEEDQKLGLDEGGKSWGKTERVFCRQTKRKDPGKKNKAAFAPQRGKKNKEGKEKEKSRK